MPDREKIRLMTRLAILEKNQGKELKLIRESYRSDFIGIPMLKNGLRITAVFLLLLCVWAAGNLDFLLDIVARAKVQMLGIGILAAYLVVLVVTLIITFLHASSGYYRSLRQAEEYENLLEELAAMESDGEME